jgi:hypothetical protein
MCGINAVNINFGGQTPQLPPLQAPAGQAGNSAQAVQDSTQLFLLMTSGKKDDDDGDSLILMMMSTQQFNICFHAGNATQAYLQNSNTIDGAAAAGTAGGAAGSTGGASA